MAKQQNLPLSPMEISGVCGRLLCCLAYENDYYGEVKRRLPRAGKMVQTPQGSGKIISVNVLKETLTVRLSSDQTIVVPASEIESKPEEARKPTPRRRRRRK
jgi:cell fate regulator YaaT (PSP1 superfamily)